MAGLPSLWKAAPITVIDKHPLSLRSLVNLASLRTEEQRHADAETILRKIYQKQKAILPGDHPDIAETRSLVKETWKGQGKLPNFVKQPVSARTTFGDEAVFHVEVENARLWAYQWCIDGRPVTGANVSELRLSNINKNHLGLYHVEVTSSPADPVIGSFASAPAYLADGRIQPGAGGGLTCRFFSKSLIALHP